MTLHSADSERVELVPRLDGRGYALERAWLWAAVGAILLSCIIRAWACRGDLWLDEIMSVEDASRASSAWDLLQHVVHRNSHMVNALWMYWVGGASEFWIYRLPSLLAGCLLVPLAAWPLRRQAGDRAAFAAALLFGTSFFLVTYSSEARAYAGLMFHALLAFRLIEATEQKPSAALDWAVAVTLLLGALWLPVFLFVWIAVTLWAPLSRRSWRPLLRMLALPWAVLAVLVSFGVLAQTSGTGPQRPRIVVLLEFLEAAFVPRGPAILIGVVGAGVAAALVLSFVRPPAFESAALRRLRLLLCAVPVAGVLASPSTSLYERYFSPALPFLYLSLVYGLLPFLTRSAVGWRAVASAVAAGVLVSNLTATAAFLRDGRGHYLEALQWMAARTPPDAPVRWFSDHPYRNGTLVEFYARFVPGARFEQVQSPSATDIPPQWAIVHQINDDQYAAPPLSLAGDRYVYRWVKTFPKSGLSGFRWHLYQLERNASATR